MHISANPKTQQPTDVTTMATRQPPEALLKRLGIDPTERKVAELIVRHGQALSEAFASPGGPLAMKEAEDGTTTVHSNGATIALPEGFVDLAWALARKHPQQHTLDLLIAAAPHAQDVDTQRDMRLATVFVITMPENFESPGFSAYALALAKRHPQQAQALLNAINEVDLDARSAAQLRKARVLVDQVLKQAPVTTATTTQTTTTTGATTTTTLSGAQTAPFHTAQAPLHIAVKKGDVVATRLLLERGADVNELHPGGNTALHMACSVNDSYGMVKLLLQYNANVNQAGVNGHSALGIAAKNGFFDLVELLLTHKADPNWRADGGLTPLLNACAGPHPDVAQALLDSGARVNDCNEVGDTPLILATGNAKPGLLTMLLLRDAKVDQANTQGATALYVACMNGSEWNVRILLEAGADPQAKAVDGTTPLQLARIRASFQPDMQRIVEMLQKQLENA